MWPPFRYKYYALQKQIKEGVRKNSTLEHLKLVWELHTHDLVQNQATLTSPGLKV